MRKSVRKSTSEHTRQTNERLQERQLEAPRKRRGALSERVLTQDELLAEAKLTAEINLRSLGNTTHSQHYTTDMIYLLFFTRKDFLGLPKKIRISNIRRISNKNPHSNAKEALHSKFRCASGSLISGAQDAMTM